VNPSAIVVLVPSRRSVDFRGVFQVPSRHLRGDTISTLKLAVECVRDDGEKPVLLDAKSFFSEGSALLPGPLFEKAVLQLFFDFRLWLFAPFEAQKEVLRTCMKFVEEVSANAAVEGRRDVRS